MSESYIGITTCHLSGKIHKLSMGLLNGFVNHLENTHLMLGCYDQVSNTVQKVKHRKKEIRDKN